MARFSQNLNIRNSRQNIRLDPTNDAVNQFDLTSSFVAKCIYYFIIYPIRKYVYGCYVHIFYARNVMVRKRIIFRNNRK